MNTDKDRQISYLCVSVSICGSNSSLRPQRFCGETEDNMIQLTRLNGQQFVVNAEKIRYIESTPDTIVCCENGEKMMVRESLQEVIRRAIDYARIIRRPITD